MKKLTNNNNDMLNLDHEEDIAAEDKFLMRLELYKMLMQQFRTDLHNIQCTNEQDETETIIFYEQTKGEPIPLWLNEFFLMKEKILNEMINAVSKTCEDYLKLANEDLEKSQEENVLEN